MERILNTLFKILLFFVSASAYSAPYETQYGRDSGYPLALQFFSSESNKQYLVAEYSGIRYEKENLTPGLSKEHHWVRKTTNNKPFDKTEVKWPWTGNPEHWIEKHAVVAVAIFKENKIIYEKYQYDRNSNQRFNSQSMAKTLTAIAVGIAVDDGLIDIEKPIKTYVPDVSGFPIGEVSVRNHLKMASGSEFKWASHGSAADYFIQKFASKDCEIPNRACGTDVREIWKKTDLVNQQGSKFDYDPRSSDILSMAVANVYGKPMSKVWEEKVWSKIYPKRDAFWRKVWYTPNLTSGANFFYATPEDYLKIANLWLDPNQKVVSKRWLDQMVQDRIPVNGHTVGWGGVTDYGYQIWIKDDWFAMAGYRGQKIFIHPKSKTAMFVSSVDGAWTKDGINFWEWLTEKSLNDLKK